MVDVEKSDTVRIAAAGKRNEARHEGARVISALDEAMNRFAIGVNSGDHHFPLLVNQRFGLIDRLCSALDSQAECLSRIVNPERDVFHTVSVFVDVRRDVAVGSECRGQYQPDLALSQNVAGSITRTGLRPAIRNDAVAEYVAVELRGLLGVADVKLYEIRSVDRKGVSDLLGRRKCRCPHDFSGGPCSLS